VAHPELAAEQAYVDHAYECLDKMREMLGRTQDAMATEFAALAMEAWAKRRARTFQDAERGLCFGRLTLDGGLRPLYVGRRWVHDDDREPLVVNWQAPAARPFYTATPSDPQRVLQRRRYRTEGRAIVDISDEAEVTIEELRHAYRVPGEIMDFALPLLDVMAPDVERPLAYRQGAQPPRLVEAAGDDLLARAIVEAAELDGLLAVIAPRSLVDAPVTGDAFDEVSVPVLTPREAKGLEFDHVVVVEPAAIVEEGGASGLRELYVALTRPTKTLTIVHSRPLPAPLG
jgi:DNA helicase IV